LRYVERNALRVTATTRKQRRRLLCDRSRRT
jgi:hypothetical protein